MRTDKHGAMATEDRPDWFGEGEPSVPQPESEQPSRTDRAWFTEGDRIPTPPGRPPAIEPDTDGPEDEAESSGQTESGERTGSEARAEPDAAVPETTDRGTGAEPDAEATSADTGEEASASTDTEASTERSRDGGLLAWLKSLFSR